MLELRRNVVFGQFVGTGSFVHHMDPRAKLLAALAFIVASFFVDGLLGFAVVVPLLVLVQAVSRVPVGYLLRGSAFFFGFLGLILVFQVLFYPGETRDDLWRWGILSVSAEGLRFAATLGARVVLLYYVTTMLMLTTSLVDLTNGLESLLAPLQKLRVPVNELVLVFVIAVKFVPIFIEEMERLARARTARGVPFDEGGVLTRARRLGRLLVPIFVGGFARADALTTAMDTRSYRGGRNRTKLRRMEASATDWLALVLVVVWMVGAWWV